MAKEEQKPVLHHWRTGCKSEYVGVEILPNGNPIIATISHIVWDENAIVQGSKKPSWIAYFKESYITKPMILNSVNRKRIIKIANTDYPETIKDLRVVLTQELTRDPNDGGKIYGLRIGRDAPAGKDRIVIGTDKFNAAIVALKNGQCDLNYITDKYEVSEEAMKLFKEALNKK